MPISLKVVKLFHQTRTKKPNDMKLKASYCTFKMQLYDRHSLKHIVEAFVTIDPIVSNHHFLDPVS